MSSTRVYVGGYHYGATHGDIMNLFYSYNIYDISRITMKSAYYCFVEFENPSEAKRAVRSMNGRTWMYGWKIRVEMARHPPNLISNEKIETESETNIERDSASTKDCSKEPLDGTIFKCEACYHTFNLTNYRPRSLPCGHTLCSNCVKVKFRVRPTCPFCKSFCGVGKTTPSDYPNNYFILKLLKNYVKVIPGSKKHSDPNLEKSKQLELSQTINNIYSCNDYLIDLKDYKREKESKLKALKEDISCIDKSIDEGEIILKKLRKVQDNIESAKEEVSLTLVTSEAELFFHEFAEWRKDALNKIQNNDSFTAKIEDTSSKTQFSHSGLHSNDLAMLELLTPMVDSDDEREVVTVGKDEDASDTIFSQNRNTVAGVDTDSQIDNNSNKNSIFESSSSSSSCDLQADRYENDQVLFSSPNRQETVSCHFTFSQLNRSSSNSISKRSSSSSKRSSNSNDNSDDNSQLDRSSSNSSSHTNCDINQTQTDLPNGNDNCDDNSIKRNSTWWKKLSINTNQIISRIKNS